MWRRHCCFNDRWTSQREETRRWWRTYVIWAIQWKRRQRRTRRGEDIHNKCLRCYQHHWPFQFSTIAHGINCSLIPFITHTLLNHTHTLTSLISHFLNFSYLPKVIIVLDSHGSSHCWSFMSSSPSHHLSLTLSRLHIMLLICIYRTFCIDLDHLAIHCKYPILTILTHMLPICWTIHLMFASPLFLISMHPMPSLPIWPLSTPAALKPTVFVSAVA